MTQPKRAKTNDGRSGPKAKASTEGARAGGPKVAEQLTETVDGLVEAEMETAEDMSEIFRIWSIDAIDSASKGLDTARQILECRDVTEAMSLQRAYVEDLAQDIIDHNSRVLNAYSRMMQHGLGTNANLWTKGLQNWNQTGSE